MKRVSFGLPLARNKITLPAYRKIAPNTQTAALWGSAADTHTVGYGGVSSWEKIESLWYQPLNKRLTTYKF